VFSYTVHCYYFISPIVAIIDYRGIKILNKTATAIFYNLAAAAAAAISAI